MHTTCNNPNLKKIVLACVLLAPFYLINHALAEDATETLSYLKELSVEDLLKTKITSVSKKPESLFNAAAAITVISEEDIRRTGARSIPEVLRLVPGLQVGQIDSSRWEVGSRGFSDYFENKLLVLINGRSMYTPLYAGVYWNSLDTILEDIERIEVIRGPGATVWGSNAVNGVINIITKKSKDTQGGLISTIYGTHEKPLVSARYGGEINPDTTYRVYAKGFQRDSFEDESGVSTHDSWESYRAGLRVDSALNTQNSLTIEAELFDGEADLESMLSGFLTPPFQRESQETEKFNGGHFLVDFKHILSATSELDFTFYYDGYTRDLIVAKEERDTLEFEFQHHLTYWKNHDIVWEAGVRWTEDDISGTFFTSFDPESKNYTLWNAFFQDDITLVDDSFWLTLGAKVEHNDFSGFEIQPSVRMRFKPASNHMLWGAVSRAVRTPSRSEQDIIINLATFANPSGNISQLRLLGNEDFNSEELIAYELGYRWQIADSFTMDIASFYNEYDELRTIEIGRPFFEATPLPPHIVIPEKFVNTLEGESFGIELSSTWQALTNLKINAGYSWIDLDLSSKDPTITTGISEENNFPRHQFQVSTYYDLTPHFSIDTELYFVDEYEADEIDDYLRFDVQLTWKPTEVFQLAVGGENLFNSRHMESVVIGSNIQPAEVPTQYWVKATYRF